MAIANAPVTLDMNTFRATLDGAGNVAKQCRFAVRIQPPTSISGGNSGVIKDLTYLCEAAEFPGRGLDRKSTRLNSSH